MVGTEGGHVVGQNPIGALVDIMSGGGKAMLVRSLYFTVKLELLFCFALVHETGSCYSIQACLKLATSTCTSWVLG